MKKRLLSLFLALVMLVSLIPTTAFAWDDGGFGSVRVTNVDVSALGEMVAVTLDADTDIDCNLVFAGYSESGKLLISAARKISAPHGETFDFPCEGLSNVGSLATVKIFALGPDNRLLGMPYETQAYSANPTQDGGSWEYRRAEYLDWQYDNGTLTITNQRKDYPGIIPGRGELTNGNSYPWEKIQGSGNCPEPGEYQRRGRPCLQRVSRAGDAEFHCRPECGDRGLLPVPQSENRKRPDR